MTPNRVQHVPLYTPEERGGFALDLSPVGLLSAGATIRESLPALPFCTKRGATPAPAGFAAKLRSALFNTAFYAGTFAFVLAALPLTLLPSRKPLAGAFRVWAKGVRALMRGLAGIKVTVEGRETLPANGAYLLAAKHQSEADGIVLMALVPDLAWVAMRQVGPGLR